MIGSCKSSPPLQQITVQLSYLQKDVGYKQQRLPSSGHSGNFEATRNEKSWRLNKKSYHLTEPERLAAVAGPGHAQPPVAVGRPHHCYRVLLDGPQAPVGVGAVEAVVR